MVPFVIGAALAAAAVGAFGGLLWLDGRTGRTAAAQQHTARRSVLTHRRPQDDLEGWR